MYPQIIFFFKLIFGAYFMGGSRGGDRSLDPGKSQVAQGFLRNSGTDPLDKQLNPSGSIASRGKSVRCTVKYVDD